MSKANDGGAAFPCSRRKEEQYMDEGGYGRTRTVTVQEGGMTLRDWFAGQALAGLITHDVEASQTLSDPKGRTLEAWMAADAFKLADAMIAEGAK